MTDNLQPSPLDFNGLKQSLEMYLSKAVSLKDEIPKVTLYPVLDAGELYSFVVEPINLSTYRQKEIDELLVKYYIKNETIWLEEIYAIWSSRMVNHLGPFPVYQEEAYHLLENSMHLLKDYLFDTFKLGNITREHIDYIYRSHLNKYLVNQE